MISPEIKIGPRNVDEEAMRCGMESLIRAGRWHIRGQQTRLGPIPDAWWMASCSQKYDSSQKSYLAFVWQKPQSIDASGLHKVSERVSTDGGTDKVATETDSVNAWDR